MQALRRQLVDSLRAFASLYRNPRLRRLQLAWIGSSVGTWGYVVALMVYAYKQEARRGRASSGDSVVPCAVAAPFGGMVGDRFPRLRVMVVSDVIRAGRPGCCSGGDRDRRTSDDRVSARNPGKRSCRQAFQPAESALLPTLAESPEELAAANVANSTIEAAGYFVGLRSAASCSPSRTSRPSSRRRRWRSSGRR